MWFPHVCCCNSVSDGDDWLPSNWRDQPSQALLKLARSRLDLLLKSQPKDILNELISVRNLLVIAEEKQLNELSRKSSDRNSRSSIKNDDLLELIAAEDNGLDEASKKWIQDTYSNFDTRSASVCTSKAALREQEAMREQERMETDVSSKAISLRIETLNMEHLNHALKSEEVAQELAHVRTLDFDSLIFTSIPIIESHPLCPLIAHMVTGKGLVWALSESGRVSDETHFRGNFFRFFEQIDKLYKDVAYHSVAHAADVLNSIGWLFISEYFSRRMSALDRVVGLAAAVVHDVAHPGLNNAFLEKSQSELALRYNDKSILENMHVSLGFETMKKHGDCDWYSLLPQKFVDPEDPGLTEVDLQHYARKLMIEMVLATDMAHHAKCVSEVSNYADEQQNENHVSSKRSSVQALRLDELDKKFFIMKTAMHTADISNPCRPRDIMLKWTDRICTEFWAQGDIERELGQSISPLCDREAGMASVPKGQLGFINFVVRPLFAPLATIVPEVYEAVKFLDENEKFWQDMDRNQVSYDDIFKSVRS